MSRVRAQYYSELFDGAKPWSSIGGMLQLTANTPLSYTVPGNSTQKFRADFEFNQNDDVWVAYNKTAVIPTPGVAVEVNQQEFRPTPKFVIGGDVLSFISTGTNVQCGVSLLQLPNPNQ
jgi:hypothetical protein